MTNILNLNNATQLYEVLGKYIPEIENEEETYLDFVGKIIENIKESGNYKVYFDAIQIMTGATHNILAQSHSEDILKLFMDSLLEWRILELVQFFREVGYSDG